MGSYLTKGFCRHHTSLFENDSFIQSKMHLSLVSQSSSTKGKIISILWSKHTDIYCGREWFWIEEEDGCQTYIYIYWVLGGTLLVGITCRECSAQNNLIALVPTGKVQRYPLFSSVFLPHLWGKFSARCQPVIGASKLVDYFGVFSWINCGYLPGMFSAVYVGCSTYQRWTFLVGGTSSGVDVRGLLLEICKQRTVFLHAAQRFLQLVVERWHYSAVGHIKEQKP